MVLALPAHAGAFFFLFFLLVDSHLVANDAARRRTGQCVVVGVVARHAADDRAGQAAGLGLARYEADGERAQQDF